MHNVFSGAKQVLNNSYVVHKVVPTRNHQGIVNVYIFLLPGKVMEYSVVI